MSFRESVVLQTWAQGGPRPFPGASGPCARPHLAGTWLPCGLRGTAVWGDKPGS